MRRARARAGAIVQTAPSVQLQRGGGLRRSERHNPFKEAVGLLSLVTIALIGFVYTNRAGNIKYTTKVITDRSQNYNTADEESRGFL